MKEKKWFNSQLIVHGHQLKSSKSTNFLWMFNEGWCFLIIRSSDVFLFTLLLLYPFWSILKSFGDTDGCPDWSVCLSMCDLLSLPECSIILSLSLLAVSPKYVSEHVFSGHLTKYVRSCLCTSFIWFYLLL